MRLKSVIFDFDGVLVESLNVKTEAFKEIYLQYGSEIADAVVRHHLANGGMSRFEKFKIYHREFLNKELATEDIESMAEFFRELVLDKVVVAPEVSGATDLLEGVYGKQDLFLITGTPTSEIREILKKKGWSHYFRRVLGSPRCKDDWLKMLREGGEIAPDSTIFVGDAMSDYRAAASNGVRFCLRVHETNFGLFEDYQGERVRDMRDFLLLLQEEAGK